MKKAFFSIIVSLSIILLASSCGTKGDPAVVWYPVNLMIFVQDQNGNDLLDPQNPYNVVDGTVFNWEAKDYFPVKEMPTLDKYRLSLLDTSIFDEDDARSLPRQGYFLNFGEIDGALDMDAIMYLTLPGSPIHEIKYHCGNHVAQTQTCQRYWILDGRETVNPFVITIDVPEE